MKTVSRKSTTKWNLIFLYFNLALSIVNGFLIVPLYLKYIDIQLYGAWLATGNILVWLTVLDPGIGDVLVQRVASSLAKDDHDDIGLQISSSIFLSFFIAALCLIVSYTISYQIGAILNMREELLIDELVNAFRLTTIGTALTLFSFSISGALLGLQKTFAVGLARSLIGVTGIIFTVVLLIKGFGIYSIALSNLYRSLLAVILYGSILYFSVKKQRIVVKFRFHYLKNYSKIFSYTFFSKLFSTIAGNIDLIIIARFIDVQSVTVFELSRRPIKIIQNFMNMPSIALLPALSNLSGEGKNDKLKVHIDKYLTLYIWLLFLSIAGYVVFNQYLINLWIGEEFYIGNSLNLLIGVSFLFTLFSYNLSNITYSLGNIKGNSLIGIVYSLVYLSILLFMGKIFGVLGIVLTPIIANFATYFWYFPKKLIQMQIIERETIKTKTQEIVILFLICTGLWVAFSLVEFHLTLLSFSIAIFIFILIYFLVTIAFTNGVRITVFSIIRELFKRTSNI